MADDPVAEKRDLQVPPGLAQEFEDQPWPVVGFATAEHNNLVALRTATISETNGRSAAYLGTLSAALIALGLVGNGGFEREFFAFGLVVLLAPALVGLMTFARSVQSSVEDIRLAQRAERVREVYVRLLPHLGEWFQTPATGGTETLRRSIGTGLPGHWQLLLTLAALIATVNSLVLGVIAGFAVRLADGVALAAVLTGTGVAVVSLIAHTTTQFRAFRSAMSA